jgi:UMF1 family MFS transporter
MYDWANSAFSTTVVSVFFGPYLTAITEAAADADGLVHLLGIPIRYDSYFAYCISASVLAEAALLPMLGALADLADLRKRLLILCSTAGAIATLLMFFVTPGRHWFGGGLFVAANVVFGASIVFYNAYLPLIASEEQRDRVSSAGYARGYIGGGLLLLFNLILFFCVGTAGLSQGVVVRICLASAGAWWLGFSFVAFGRLRARQTARTLGPGESLLSAGFTQLSRLVEAPVAVVIALTLLPLAIPVMLVLGAPVRLALVPGAGPIGLLALFMSRKARTLPEAIKYLAAYLLYNDGIQTVISVATIFAAQELKMSWTSLALLILMIQFVAFGGAHGFNAMAELVGARNAILLGLLVWSGATVYAFAGMKSAIPVPALGIPRQQLEFWLLGAAIALVLGGTQALSRSLFSQMIPKDQEAEFYGFYEISERGTSWIGPLVFGLVNQRFQSLRLGILSVVTFFVAGLVVLPFVDVPSGIQQARRERPGAPAPEPGRTRS